MPLKQARCNFSYLQLKSIKLIPRVIDRSVRHSLENETLSCLHFLKRKLQINEMIAPNMQNDIYAERNASYDDNLN